MLPNDNVSMSVGHLDHVLTVYSSTESNPSHTTQGIIIFWEIIRDGQINWTQNTKNRHYWWREKSEIQHNKSKWSDPIKGQEKINQTFIDMLKKQQLAAGHLIWEIKTSWDTEPVCLGRNTKSRERTFSRKTYLSYSSPVITYIQLSCHHIHTYNQQ